MTNPFFLNKGPISLLKVYELLEIANQKKNDFNFYNIKDLYTAIIDDKLNEKPTVIVANTIKGKGVSFMEDDNNWHYRIPTKNEVLKSKKELGIK